jgi:selenocysteine-specific elongation factor
LLDVKFGVIALTKTDRVDDPAWLELVTNDIQNEVKNTFLENCPIIPVSAKTKSGLGELLAALELVLKSVPARMDHQRPRLSVDRVFSLSGFGTVVTGTLNDGKLAIGNDITILPLGINGRIRGLQTHKQKVDEVIVGSRVAINISGVDVKDIKRGDLVTNTSFYKPSTRLDAYVKILPISSKAIKHNSEIKLFHLAAERLGRVRVLGKEEILPGEEGFVQIELTEPIVAYKNDRFVLRIPSPGETVGGGVIIQTDSPKRYKRFSPEIIQKLTILNSGTNEERILNTVHNFLICSTSIIATDLRLSEGELNDSLHRLIVQGDIIELIHSELTDKYPMVISRKNWQSQGEKTVDILKDYHSKYPLRFGMSKEELKNKLKLENKTYNLLFPELIHSKIICEQNGYVYSPTHTVSYSQEQLVKIKTLDAEIDKTPFSPPTISEIKKLLDEELFNSYAAKQEYIKVSNEVVFRQKEYQMMKDFVIKKITEDGTLTVAEFRDYFNTSRKYALAMLEHLDSIGITIRDGDFRKAGNFSKG